jgi:hypothetical protein
VEQVVRRIVAPGEQGLESSLPASGAETGLAEAAQFVRLLEQRFNFRKLQREERTFRRLSGKREAGRLLSVRKVDFPLYSVYKSFKRTVSGRR